MVGQKSSGGRRGKEKKWEEGMARVKVVSIEMSRMKVARRKIAK